MGLFSYVFSTIILQLEISDSGRGKNGGAGLVRQPDGAPCRDRETLAGARPGQQREEAVGAVRPGAPGGEEQPAGQVRGAGDALRERQARTGNRSRGASNSLIYIICTIWLLITDKYKIFIFLSEFFMQFMSMSKFPVAYSHPVMLFK